MYTACSFAITAILSDFEFEVNAFLRLTNYFKIHERVIERKL